MKGFEEFIMKKSIKAAAGGLCTALSVVLMLLGSVLYIFTYAVPMLLGILITMLKKTFGKGTAFSVYLATAFISFLLVSDKECVLMYVLFFGYYPIIKPHLEKIKPKPLSYLLKFLIFNASVIIIELISVYVFGIPFFEDGVFSKTILCMFALLMNIIFFMYEFLLKYYLLIYEKKLEKRIIKLFRNI